MNPYEKTATTDNGESAGSQGSYVLKGGNPSKQIINQPLPSPTVSPLATKNKNITPPVDDGEHVGPKDIHGL